jgi:hypothetical protein
MCSSRVNRMQPCLSRSRRSIDTVQMAVLHLASLVITGSQPQADGSRHSSPCDADGVHADATTRNVRGIILARRTSLLGRRLNRGVRMRTGKGWRLI